MVTAPLLPADWFKEWFNSPYYLQLYFERDEKMAKLLLGDFNDMFSFYGLQMQEVFGDYELNTYDVKKSPRLLMVAGKK